MTSLPKQKHILISFAEHEKSKPRKVCLSMSGDHPPAAIPHLSARTSPNHRLMAFPTSHIYPHPKLFHLQDVHELVQFHLASLQAE
jgi:hypothetical protein